jgi:hypothetical protein
VSDDECHALCSSDWPYWDAHLVQPYTGAGNESGTPPPGKEAVTSGDILQTLYASGDGPSNGV